MQDSKYSRPDAAAARPRDHTEICQPWVRPALYWTRPNHCHDK